MPALEGKVALITGAARGQGRSHAVRLAAEGADIIAIDICAQIESVPYPLARPADLEQTAAEVRALGGRIVTAHADVRSQAELRAAVDAAVGQLGRLDIVCANAGIHSSAPAHEMPEQAWQDLIDVNLTGVWLTCKVAVPHIIAGGRGGVVIVTASVAGHKPYATISHYVAAKHGLIGLTKTLAQELAPHGIRVNAVSPTQVDTDMIQNDMIYRLFVPGAERPTREQFAEASQATNLLPVPWVEPSDVSDAVAFLAGDGARFITGVSLPVDAGVLAK
ncbi:MAG TPA: mycofactocin-coupled SDR family oxidoreductase [Trebonia sp.]